MPSKCQQRLIVHMPGRPNYHHTFSASLEDMFGLTLPRHSLTNNMPYIIMRSAGPLISKLRKNVLARYSERTSSRQSYDSLSGSISRSDDPGGSRGSVYAGPRVRVRRGRIGKFPINSSKQIFLVYSLEITALVQMYGIPMVCTLASSRKIEW